MAIWKFGNQKHLEEVSKGGLATPPIMVLMHTGWCSFDFVLQWLQTHALYKSGNPFQVKVYFNSFIHFWTIHQMFLRNACTNTVWMRCIAFSLIFFYITIQSRFPVCASHLNRTVRSFANFLLSSLNQVAWTLLILSNPATASSCWSL